MATQTFITLVCDRCGKESSDRRPVATHSVSLDRKLVDVEVCDPCWNRSTTAVAELLTLGRRRRADGTRKQPALVG